MREKFTQFRENLGHFLCEHGIHAWYKISTGSCGMSCTLKCCRCGEETVDLNV